MKVVSVFSSNAVRKQMFSKMLSCSLNQASSRFKPLSREVSNIHHPCSAGKPLGFCLFGFFYTHQPSKHTALTPQRLLPEATTNTAQEQHEELGKEPRHPDSNVICNQNEPHPRGPPPAPNSQPYRTQRIRCTDPKPLAPCLSWSELFVWAALGNCLGL